MKVFEFLFELVQRTVLWSSINNFILALNEVWLFSSEYALLKRDAMKIINQMSATSKRLRKLGDTYRLGASQAA
jgi:hypothetical protein